MRPVQFGRGACRLAESIGSIHVCGYTARDSIASSYSAHAHDATKAAHARRENAICPKICTLQQICHIVSFQIKSRYTFRDIGWMESRVMCIPAAVASNSTARVCVCVFGWSFRPNYKYLEFTCQQNGAYRQKLTENEPWQHHSFYALAAVFLVWSANVCTRHA